MHPAVPGSQAILATLAARDDLRCEGYVVAGSVQAGLLVESFRW